MNVTEPPGPSGPLESALQALDERRPQDAAAVLRDHLWRDPTDAVGYAVLGVSLAQLGDTESALEALEHAHYLHPNNTRILFNYGLALESAGRPRDARIRLSAAVRLDPEYEPARLHLARLETQGQAATSDDFALLDRGASAPSVSPSVARERVPTDEEIEQGLRGLLETAPWVQNPDPKVEDTAAAGTGAGAAPSATEPANWESRLPVPLVRPKEAEPEVEDEDEEDDEEDDWQWPEDEWPWPTAWPAPPKVHPYQATRARMQPRVIAGVGVGTLLLAGFVGIMVQSVTGSGTAAPTLPWATPKVPPAEPTPRAERYAPGAALADANLVGENLRNTNLGGADLERARLATADMTDANLTNALLRGADLQRANLTRAQLTAANLEGADLRAATLKAADLKGCDLSRVNGAGAYFRNAVLTQADLSQAVLRGADLSEARLLEANLRGADLGRANLKGAVLWGAKLEDADLRGAKLERANLRSARLEGADLEGASLGNARLSGARYDSSTRWPVGFNPRGRGAVATGG